MTSLNTKLENEHISDKLYKLVDEVFFVEYDIVLSEQGCYEELDFDKKAYIDKLSFDFKVNYLITNCF